MPKNGEALFLQILEVPVSPARENFIGRDRWTSWNSPAGITTSSGQFAASLIVHDVDIGLCNSWDLRGINDTIPVAKCFQSQQLADNFWAGSLWYEGVSGISFD